MRADPLEATLRDLARSQLEAAVTRIDWLPGQLGTRRFARLHLSGPGPARAIARIDAPEDPAGRPPGLPPEPPLEPIRALLERAGLPVPARHGGDVRAGIELLEDVGDLPLRDVAARAPATELRRLYEEACDLVPRLQRVTASRSVAAFSRRLDDGLFAYKAELFCRNLLRPDAPASHAAAVREAFAFVASVMREAPARLAHRDLQSANLHVVESRPAGRLVMIDLQGAFLAPPEYDLVCLLRDSYVELPRSEVDHQLARIRPELPDAPTPDEFERRFDLLTLTRKGKDLARFVHVARERGAPHLLVHAPPSLRALRGASARAARRDPPLAVFAEIVSRLPETPCAP